MHYATTPKQTTPMGTLPRPGSLDPPYLTRTGSFIRFYIGESLLDEPLTSQFLRLPDLRGRDQQLLVHFHVQCDGNQN